VFILVVYYGERLKFKKKFTSPLGKQQPQHQHEQNSLEQLIKLLCIQQDNYIQLVALVLLKKIK